MKNPISNTVSIAFLKVNQIEFDINLHRFYIKRPSERSEKVRLVDGMWTTDDFRYSQRNNSTDGFRTTFSIF